MVIEENLGPGHYGPPIDINDLGNGRYGAPLLKADDYKFLDLLDWLLVELDKHGIVARWEFFTPDAFGEVDATRIVFIGNRDKDTEVRFASDAVRISRGARDDAGNWLDTGEGAEILLTEMAGKKFFDIRALAKASGDSLPNYPGYVVRHPDGGDPVGTADQTGRYFAYLGRAGQYKPGDVFRRYVTASSEHPRGDTVDFMLVNRWVGGGGPMGGGSVVPAWWLFKPALKTT